jgi:hypothetical protein
MLLEKPHELLHWTHITHKLHARDFELFSN